MTLLSGKEPDLPKDPKRPRRRHVTCILNLHTFITSSLFNVLAVLALHLSIVTHLLTLAWSPTGVQSRSPTKMRTPLPCQAAMDVLSPFISVLCHSGWLFHGESCQPMMLSMALLLSLYTYFTLSLESTPFILSSFPFWYQFIHSFSHFTRHFFLFWFTTLLIPDYLHGRLPGLLLLSYSVLANANSRSRSLYAIARPSVCRLSVVCNVRAPYSAGWNLRECSYAIWYLGHQLTSTKI